MARFLRCVGVDNVAYHINLHQVAWVFRGAHHTVVKLCGGETVSVREAPHHITGHASEHEERETMSTHRTRMGVGVG